MALDTRIALSVKAALTSTSLDLVRPDALLSYSSLFTLLTGTSTNQADKIYSDTQTLNASSNINWDLAGGWSDALGSTLTFVKLKALIIKARETNVNNVRITRPATLGVPLFLAASDGIDIQPGGMFMYLAPGAGITVTAATGDLINVANSGAGTAVVYDLIVIGTSA